MKNENVCICEKCGKEILKMTQLMHSNHCPGNRQDHSQQPLIDLSDVDLNLIDNDNNNNKGEDDMQYKMCTKCNLYFSENEYEDHMLCHKIEDDDTAEVNRQQQERQQRQQQQQQRQQMHSHVHQQQHQQRPSYQHHQPQSSIQRVIRTSTDINGNRIQEREDRYSDGRIVISKVVLDPYGNRISTSTSSYSTDHNNNTRTHNIFNIPGISIFTRRNNPYTYNISFDSPNYHQRRRIGEPVHYNMRLPFNQMPFSIENLLNQFMAIPRTNPVPQEVIDDLPQTVVNDASKLSSEKKNCVICLTDFENGDKTIVLPCIHLFHYDCIVQWFGSHNSCPVCKYEVTGNNNH